MPGARKAVLYSGNLIVGHLPHSFSSPGIFNSPVPDPFPPDRPANTIDRPVSDPPALGN